METKLSAEDVKGISEIGAEKSTVKGSVYIIESGDETHRANGDDKNLENSNMRSDEPKELKVESSPKPENIAEHKSTPSPRHAVPSSIQSSGQSSVQSSQWGSYFKRAVANMEQTLDKILVETSTEVTVGPKKMPISPNIQSTGERPSMQERLAMAVGSANRTPSPSRSSLESRSGTGQNTALSSSKNFRSSDEQPRTGESTPLESSQPEYSVRSSVELKSRPFSNEELDQPPSLDLVVKLAKELYDVVMLLDIPFDKDIVKSSFVNLIQDIELQQQRAWAENTRMSQRIDALEAKLKYLTQNEVERATATKKSSSGLEKKLAERDEQIALLFQEGQELAKKELQYMNTIKKLRQKEREIDRSTEQFSSRVTRLEQDLAESKEKLRRDKELAKRQEDKIRSLSKFQSENVQIKNENMFLRSKVTDLEGQLKELAIKLDGGTLVAQTEELSKAEEELSSTKSELESWKMKFTMLTNRRREERDALETQLQKEIETSSKVQNDLRNEINNLENRVEHFRSLLEEANSHKADKDSYLSLLRQVEVLQTQHSIATENWQGIESSLLEKISSLEKEVKDCKEQENSLRRKYKSLGEQTKNQTEQNEQLREFVHDLESDLTSLRMAKEEAMAKATRVKTSYEQLKNSFDDEKSNHDSLVKDLQQKLERAESEVSRLSELNRVSLNESLDGFKPLDPQSPDRQRSVNAYELTSPTGQTIHYYSRNQSFDEGSTRPAGHRSTSRQTSAVDIRSSLIRSPSTQSFEDNSENGDRFEELPSGFGSFMRRGTSPLDGVSRGGDSTSGYAMGGGQASFYLVGKMNSTVRRLELELANSKQDLAKMTTSKEEAYQEVVRLMKDNEELQEYRAKTGELEKQIQELRKRELTTLEMLGEKSEQVEELKADVQDLKSMYRQQIEDLVGRLNKK